MHCKFMGRGQESWDQCHYSVNVRDRASCVFANQEEGLGGDLRQTYSLDNTTLKKSFRRLFRVKGNLPRALDVKENRLNTV